MNQAILSKAIKSRAAGKMTAFFLCAGSMLLSAAMAFPQEMPSPMGPIPGADSSQSSRDQGTSNNSPSQGELGQNAPSQRTANAREENPGSSTMLSTNQIIAILHERPEVVVDLKQVVADYFQKEGISVQPDSITDEILFSNLATNAELRQTVSAWLRARGYASDADFEQSTEPLPDAEPMQPGGDARDLESDSTNGMSQLALALQNLPADSEIAPQDSTRPQGSINQQDSSNQQDAIRQLSRSRQQDAPSSNERPKVTDATKQSTRDTLSTSKKAEREEGDNLELLHQSAPYNLQALRDLYTQVPEQSASVRRFGADVFLTRGMATKEMPIDLPIGPDYVLGPGDGLTISLWGGVSQNFTRVIDREGKVVLPEAGSIVVAGLTLDRAQALVQGVLTPQFKDAHVAVSVSRLRTVRVYVVGDVQRPGAYDISSLSTPLNALYAAGGPTSVGSLRTVRHYRGSTLIREVDLYDFLLNGIRADVERLEPGDTILVPAAGPQVEVTGMVKRPAIYEFKSEMKLSDVLNEAGGVRVSAALAHIRVERIEADGHRSTMEVGLPQGSTLDSARARMDSFVVKDGDRVIVAPILPYSEKAIYLTGHVVRPGKLPYHDAMKLSDAIRSYQDLLPEPSDHGEIIRLMPPDLRPEAIDFSVADVLAGGSPDISSAV